MNPTVYNLCVPTKPKHSDMPCIKFSNKLRQVLFAAPKVEESQLL